MKKLMILIVAIFSLAACATLNPEMEIGIDASKLVFDITVTRPDAIPTKGVKNDWESGDAVYLFFEDNTSAYAKMTYDGSVWTTSVIGSLNVSASGKKLTAVFLPYNTDDPVYSEGWTFSETYAYYLSAEAVSYTVDTENIPATLTATIQMAMPAGFVQFFIPDASPVTGTYMLTESHIAPAGCGAITPGGAVAQTFKNNGYAMPGIVAMVSEEKGYYFYGILDAANRGIATSFLFQLVTQEPSKGYALNSRTKKVEGTLDPTTVGAAVKFDLSNGWSAPQPCVDLGFGNIKWATGNVAGNTQGNGSIVDPLEAGGYYSWMRTSVDGSTEGGTDTANWLLGDSWRMPTVAEFNALANTTDNTVWSHKTGWTAIGSNTSGNLVTSKVNGLSIFLPASAGEDERGNYWSSESQQCFFMQGVGYIYGTSNAYGFSVRPVKEIIPTSNLVHYWPFNGNTNDAVTSGAINGENNGATLTTDRFGNPNQAYSFVDGNKITIGQAGSFDASTSFTFNVWINTTQMAGSTGRHIIRTDGGFGGNGWFVRFVGDGKLEVWESGYGATTTTTGYNDGTWHMVTFVRDVAQLKGTLYVDGNEVCSYTVPSAQGLVNSYTDCLGCNGNDYEWYAGKMDEVRLYNKALTAAEVEALYLY